jgi:hypothetical protein
MDYPALTTGLVTAPRGIGSMVAMFLALLINRVDNRLIILFGLLLTAVSMRQMRSRLSECFARAIGPGTSCCSPPAPTGASSSWRTRHSGRCRSRCF